MLDATISQNEWFVPLIPVAKQPSGRASVGRRVRAVGVGWKACCVAAVRACLRATVVEHSVGTTKTPHLLIFDHPTRMIGTTPGPTPTSTHVWTKPGGEAYGDL